ncbi:hypothetical protein [Mycobacterium sp. SMC-4]|uniref:hypothetical protein n=1 Tax=Mycobacterium sp. SMC-4 TaxID=2857059 RepID=UPI003D08F62B
MAGGLALSASLYPTVGEVPIPGFLDLPSVGRALGLPVLTESISTAQTVEAKQAGIAELLQLAAIIAQHPYLVPAETLKTLTQSPGFLELLERLGPGASPADGVSFGQTLFMVGFAGGGGGGYGAVAVPASLTEWLLFLNLLLHRVPVQALNQLSEALVRMVPEYVAPEVVQQATVLIEAVAVLPPPEPVPAPPPAQSVAPAAPELPGPAPSFIVTFEAPVDTMFTAAPIPVAEPAPVVVEPEHTPVQPPDIPPVEPELPPIIPPQEIIPDPVVEAPEQVGDVDLGEDLPASEDDAGAGEDTSGGLSPGDVDESVGGSAGDGDGSATGESDARIAVEEEQQNDEDDATTGNVSGEDTSATRESDSVSSASDDDSDASSSSDSANG